MADLYAEGKQATDDAAEEIIHRLEEKKNFISESERVRRDYAYVLLREYRNHLKDRAADSRQHRPCERSVNSCEERGRDGGHDK